MAATYVYDGVMSGALIAAAMTNASNCVAIPYSNGQRVIIIEEI